MKESAGEKRPPCRCCGKEPAMKGTEWCELCGGRPDWSRKCVVCGEKPVVRATGLCGPCTFGEAETAGGNW